MIQRYSNLTLKSLNELVEFRTSIAIITSVFSGTAYSYYVNNEYNIYLFLAMVIASILLDGAATVFNHYFDFKKAKTKEGYLYNVHNPIVAHGIPPFIAFMIGLLLVGIAGLLGLYIIFATHWILIFIGGVSILIAYFYSGGKYPISYSPFGEVVSGLFEGSIVFSISYFIQSSSFSFMVFLISIPIALSISNIMLANNICDIDEDKENGRRTLPIIIGRDSSIKLLIISHALMFILNTIYLILGYLPLSMIIIYFLLPKAIKNILIFNKNRKKSRGFVYILKNTIMFNTLEILGLVFSSLL